jgi:hypothetical protein
MTYEWMPPLVSGLGFSRLERTPYRLPQPEEVSNIEEKIGGALPGAYRYFLDRWGGGYLGDSEGFIVAPIKDPCPWGDDVSPELWYQLGGGDQSSLESVLNAYSGRIPKGVLPVAHDAFGNEICLDVKGSFPGSVWFWDHEQGWFVEQASEEYPESLHSAAREIEREGVDTRGFSIHDVIRSWARLHSARWDRPPEYMGMYRMADSFTEFLLSLRRVRYDSLPRDPE